MADEKNNGNAPGSIRTDDAAESDALFAENGGYGVLKTRLAAAGDSLFQKTQALNRGRIAAFGSTEQRVLFRSNALTDNKCTARDIVRIGDLILLGYNVFFGLRKETAVADVFSLYTLKAGDEGGAEDAAGLESVPLEGTFLEDPRFTADFRELYTYYRQASLTQLMVTHEKLLAAFKIGEKAQDLRVFRWGIDRNGTVSYIDNRGERDIALPSGHDFEWTQAARENQVGGRFPHVNILDTIFVETTGGDLTIKIENNTETGFGIYSEAVEDKNQSLMDAEFAYARLGALILLKIKPYREQNYRYLIFNTRNNEAVRMDAVGVSCIQLPEDQGIIFPGGFYLQSGEYKQFDLPAELRQGLRFRRSVRSPNGEDVLYVFYQVESGRYALFSYNVIEKKLSSPIIAAGCAMFPDGRMLVAQVTDDEPVRTHPMQLWITPFTEEGNTAAKGTDFFARIGNAALVRGISDFFAVARAVREQQPSRIVYEDLIRQCSRILDACFWLDSNEVLTDPAVLPAVLPAVGTADAAVSPLSPAAIAAVIKTIGETAQSALAEFEKIDAIRRESAQALALAEGEQAELTASISSALWRTPDDFIVLLGRIRKQRGSLQTLRELRYVDSGRIEAMDGELEQEQERVGLQAARFLSGPGAFDSYGAELARLGDEFSRAETTAVLDTLIQGTDALASGLDLLTEQINSLPGGDVAARTEIVDRMSGIYADINKLRAGIRIKRKETGGRESAAEFGARFKLFERSLENALEFADTPEKCEEVLTQLLTQLEELEGRFSEYEEYAADIGAKREDVYEALEGQRQRLLDARQRKSQGLLEAGRRIVEGIPRRLARFKTPEDLHGYFAADPLVTKVRALIRDLRDMDAALAADDLETFLKTTRDQALGTIRDKQDLAGAGENTLKLGAHKFTINRQALDLTIIPKDGDLCFHLSGTDYFLPLDDPRLARYREFWDYTLVSESPDLYRGEYLAGSILEAALEGDELGITVKKAGVNWKTLQSWLPGTEKNEKKLTRLVAEWTARRYAEGYQKGVHDHDALLILKTLIEKQAAAGRLASAPQERALAFLYWEYGLAGDEREALVRRAYAAGNQERFFNGHEGRLRLTGELAAGLAVFSRTFVSGGIHGVMGFDETDLESLAVSAAAYLFRELEGASPVPRWTVSGAGLGIAEGLRKKLKRSQLPPAWEAENAPPAERWLLLRDWVYAYTRKENPELLSWAEDAALLLLSPVERNPVHAELEGTITDLLGEHPRLEGGKLKFNLNDFWRRYRRHCDRVIPGIRAVESLRAELLETERASLNLGQFKAKPLSTFVRNRLIDQVYLPIIGDNMAKQIGAAGGEARTDRMGLLLLISPPGYGKTTLMEYVADRLGLIFVRINCPVLGHEIRDLDPAGAKGSAARQELEKLNLGLAMGNNVMLYLDDIQHSGAEFLQKFIALADGTRRVEGIWKGKPRTYDLRGKRFALVMAGNPYTESGDVFKIPDMLANRADIYNLGDILSGREKMFALSYIENSLTSNPLLLPLASRDPGDIRLLVRLAGEDISANDGADTGSAGGFSHSYSQLELRDLVELLKRLFFVRDLLLKVNLQYIESAAQKDAYRTEPPFKLQGSYRNMNRLASRINPQQTNAELLDLLRDHYRGEAQTLTTGAEENLLKLGELFGSQSPEETRRWEEIKAAFVKRRNTDSAGAQQRIAGTLTDIARAIEGLGAGKV
jgi:hypothetical protein